jgi:IS1 family transposase
MNQLSTSDRAGIVAALVEGNSIRATCRMTGAAKNTVVKLLRDLGAACAEYADANIRGVRSAQIQCDEIWSFCYAKARNVPAEHKGEFGYGDVWTWTAIDSDTKLMLSWMVGKRDGLHAVNFITDVAGRVEGRPQITTDGLHAYTWAVYAGFRGEVDHAVVEKVYGSTFDAGRYSPPVCKGCKKKAAWGKPDLEKASTSYVERQNLTMRMGMRRFTRLTNAFSKKVENLEHAVSLHFMHYNFCRVHQTLKRTPAQAAGLADHVWSLAELVSLLDERPAKVA